MIVQFADERLLGLLLVAEAEHRSTVSKSAQEEREPISPKKTEIDSNRLPQNFLREVIPHV